MTRVIHRRVMNHIITQQVPPAIWDYKFEFIISNRFNRFVFLGAKPLSFRVSLFPRKASQPFAMKRSTDSATYRDRLKRLRLKEEGKTIVTSTASFGEKLGLAGKRSSASTNAEIEAQSSTTKDISRERNDDAGGTSNAGANTINPPVEEASVESRSERPRKDPVQEGTVYFSWPQGYSDSFKKLLGKLHFTHSQSRGQRDFFLNLWNQRNNRYRKGLGLNFPNAYNSVIIGNDVDRGTPVSHFIKEKGVQKQIETQLIVPVPCEETSKGAETVLEQGASRGGASEETGSVPSMNQITENLLAKDLGLSAPERHRMGDEVIRTISVDISQKGKEVETEGDGAGQEENTSVEGTDTTVGPEAEESGAHDKDNLVSPTVLNSTLVIAPSSSAMDTQLTTSLQEKANTGMVMQKKVDSAIITSQDHSDRLQLLESEVRRLHCSLHFMKNLGSEVDSMRCDLKELSEECTSLRKGSDDISSELSDLRADLIKYWESYDVLAASHETFKTQVNLEISAIQARLICLEAHKLTGDENERRKKDASEFQKGQDKGFQLCIDSLVNNKAFPPEMLHNEVFMGMVADSEDLKRKLQHNQEGEWPAW